MSRTILNEPFNQNSKGKMRVQLRMNNKLMELKLVAPSTMSAQMEDKNPFIRS